MSTASVIPTASATLPPPRVDAAHYERRLRRQAAEIRRLERSLADAEARCRQAQRTEAIGQLTGAVAHDFNNILAAILANSCFLIDAFPRHDPRRADAEEIKHAAERAASLTRQLLAFSRRQELEPTVVDLNAPLAGIERMLRRLIGEDIDLAITLAGDAGAVRIDVGQLEQVLVNLVVNARDAMPLGGKLSIETAAVELAEESLGAETPVIPGKYATIVVTDTGSGMDARTRRRLFEPYFTTKEPGKGTGLGLSTCQRIVKRSGGYIGVSSEPGRGTVFKVYLPAAALAAAREDMTRLAESAKGYLQPHQREATTILLVEDDASVRAAVTRMLEGAGHRVVVASDGAGAIAAARAHRGPIHLVLTDVVIPGGSGPEVIRCVRERFAAAKALFMSGFSEHAALRHEAVQPGVNFIQKPFAPDALARKVRDALDA